MLFYFTSTFSKIGHWIQQKENIHPSFVKDILHQMDDLTTGLVVTLLSSFSALLAIRILLAIPRFFSILVDGRRVKYLKIEKELIHKKQESFYMAQELNNLSTKIADLEETNCSNNEKIENLKEENKLLEESSLSLQEQSEISQKTIEHLKLVLEEKTAKIEEISSENLEKTNQMDQINSENAEKNKEIAFLKEDLERLRQVEQTCNRQEVLIENVLAQFFIEGSSEMVDDVSNLKKIIQDLLSPNELRSHYLGCLKKLNKSEDSVVQLKSELAKVDETISAKEGIIDEMRRQIHDLESKLSLTNDLLNSTMNQIYEEKAEILLMAREKAQADKKIKEFETNSNMHRAHLKEYDSLINSVRQARDMMEDKYRASQLVVGKQEQAIAGLKERISSLECSLTKEIRINEANQPFVSQRDMHPCFLSFINGSNRANKATFDNSAVLENLKKEEALNVSDYRFPSVRTGQNTDVMSVGSDISRRSVFSNNPSHSSFVPVLSVPVSSNMNPLMSTFVHQSNENSSSGRNIQPPVFPSSLACTAPSLPPCGNLIPQNPRSGLVPTQYAESNCSSVKQESTGDKTDYQVPSVSDRNAGFIPINLPNMPASKFFTPESTGNTQFEDPFATIENIVPECPDNTLDNYVEKSSDVSSNDHDLQIKSSNVDYF